MLNKDEIKKRLKAMIEYLSSVPEKEFKEQMSKDEYLEKSEETQILGVDKAYELIVYQKELYEARLAELEAE